jgi:pimeloyl-ACP methyl ester carboxylesterase
MSVFILVHGAWHGGWCWRHVADHLRNDQHDAYSPTLTGLGERNHLVTSQIRLSTHVQDICNLIEFESLHDAILVGHSYAGMVITGVADKMSERIAQLVYLDALVPEVGQSAYDILTPAYRERLEASRRENKPEWLIPVPEDDHPFGVTSAADVSWLKKKLVAHPLKTLTDPLYFDPRTVEKKRRSYIFCRRPNSGLTTIANRIRDDPGWTYREITTGHDAMVTEPLRIAKLLTELSLVS